MDDTLKNLKRFTDEDGERISLPIDDFEEIMEQILERPEIEAALEEIGKGGTIPWEKVKEELKQERDGPIPD